MRLGTLAPSYCSEDNIVPADAIRTYAQRAEEVEFDGLWALDHLVKPDLYRTSVLDTLTVLSHATAVTDSIDIGTSILILPLRRTANVASRAVSLQHLSGGALTLGLGIGYVPEEFEAAGVPRNERGPRLSEGIEVLQRLFEGESSFEGRFHSFEDIQIDPIPDVPPRMIAGGGSIQSDGDRRIPRPILDRILTVGGWIAPPLSPEKAADEWKLIAEYAIEQGVNPDDIDRILLNYTHVVDSADRASALTEQQAVFDGLFSSKRGFDFASEHCLVGTLDDIVDRLAAYQSIGFDEVIAGPASNDPRHLGSQPGLFEEHILPHF